MQQTYVLGEMTNCGRSDNEQLSLGVTADYQTPGKRKCDFDLNKTQLVSSGFAMKCAYDGGSSACEFIETSSYEATPEEDAEEQNGRTKRVTPSEPNDQSRFFNVQLGLGPRLLQKSILRTLFGLLGGLQIFMVISLVLVEVTIMVLRQKRLFTSAYHVLFVPIGISSMLTAKKLTGCHFVTTLVLASLALIEAIISICFILLRPGYIAHHLPMSPVSEKLAKSDLSIPSDQRPSFSEPNATFTFVKEASGNDLIDIHKIVSLVVSTFFLTSTVIQILLCVLAQCRMEISGDMDQDELVCLQHGDNGNEMCRPVCKKKWKSKTTPRQKLTALRTRTLRLGIG